MKSNQAIIRYKDQDYTVVTIVESRRCPRHQAALVSEAITGTDGELTVPIQPGRKVLHCPFCGPGSPS